MARGMDFWKPKLGEYTAPLSLCSCQYPLEVSHCLRNRVSVSSGKGLNFFASDVFMLLKNNKKYHW